MMRQLLTNAIKEEIGKETEVGIAFSGGTDSVSLMFCCMDLGIKPTLYTYYLEGYASEDHRYSKAIAKVFDMPFVDVEVPTDPETVKKDIIRVIQMGIKGKVNTQCCHGYLYIAPLIKEKILLNGSAADTLSGTFKSHKMLGLHKNPEAFRKYRANKVSNIAETNASIAKIFEPYGIKSVYPYLHEKVVEYLLSKDFNKINKPKYKWITVKDFEYYYKKLPRLYRARGSQQIVAGTRDLHDKILLESSLNFNNRKRVDEIYKDIGDKYGNTTRKAEAQTA